MIELKYILNSIVKKTSVEEPYYTCEIKKYYVTTENIFEAINHNVIVDGCNDVDVKSFLKNTTSFSEKNLIDLFERLHKQFSIPNTQNLKKLISLNKILYSKELHIFDGEEFYVDVEYVIDIDRRSIVEYDKNALLDAIEAYTNSRIYEYNYGRLPNIEGIVEESNSEW